MKNIVVKELVQNSLKELVQNIVLKELVQNSLKELVHRQQVEVHQGQGQAPCHKNSRIGQMRTTGSSTT